MSEDALAFLSKTLDLGSEYDLAEPGSEVAWEDVAYEASEDGSRLSFFVVTEEKDNLMLHVYESPDWPSAEKFANTRL